MPRLNVSRYEPLFTPALAAERVGTSVMTLRMYEQKGLVLPHRKPSGHRAYSIHDLEIILCVREMIAEEGLNIAGIRRLMSLIPCWKWKKCLTDDRNRCSVYTVGGAPCWSVEESVCRRNGEDCRSCRVYRELPECRSLRKMMIAKRRD